MQLSRNFSLQELIKSDTAIRKGIDNNPNSDQIEKLKLLCENILQPVRDHFGRVKVTSGYRSVELCMAIGSSANSQHAKSEAADFEVMGTDNVWNPGDTISVEMDFCNNTNVSHNWYPGVTIESDSSLTSLHVGHIWFYAMVADECHAISWGTIANTSLISDTIVEFRAYPEALNCQNQPEYCINGDTLTFEVPIVVQVVSAEPEPFTPEEFSLHQNYPNPFNPVTTLRYDIPENSHVTITIYDMLGREVKTLINQTQDAGYRSIIWNATNDYDKPVSAGIYLYQIQAGEYIRTKKMVLLK